MCTYIHNICLSPNILALGSFGPSRASGLYNATAPLSFISSLHLKGREHSTDLGSCLQRYFIYELRVRVARWALPTFASEGRGLDHQHHNHSSQECDLRLLTKIKLFKVCFARGQPRALGLAWDAQRIPRHSGHQLSHRAKGRF